MTCPLGSNYGDQSGALYGPNSFSTISSYCNSSDPSLTQVKASSVQVVCTPCGVNTYTVTPSNSSGQPGGAVTSPCLPCPSRGAVCTNGGVVPLPGYWGAVEMDGKVGVGICPPGYCCDGGNNPCSSLDAVALHHAGPLGGDCEPGYGLAMDSDSCVPTSACALDAPLVWPIVVVVLLFVGLLNLLGTGVWSTSYTTPNARIKLILYFAQVGR